MLFCGNLIQFLHQKNESILFLSSHIPNPASIITVNKQKKNGKTFLSISRRMYKNNIKTIYSEIVKKSG